MGEIEPFVFQFSWANKKEVERINSLALKLGIPYFHAAIPKKLPGTIGALGAISKNRKKVLELVRTEGIQVVMPRSTMPALIVLSIFKKLKNFGIELVFDADGLPIQERLDQGFLTKNSIPYQILTKIERLILQKADKVLCRTRKAIHWHLSKSPHLNKEKFFIVGNGRDPNLFYFDKETRRRVRNELGLKDEVLLVHSGSLGPGYALEKVFQLLSYLKSKEVAFRMLFLTRNDSILSELTPTSLNDCILSLQVPFKDIPTYLNAADFGISLRAPHPSVQGILPIKFGEYLMCGLPVIVSQGIGDLDELVQGSQSCYFLDHQQVDWQHLLDWMRGAQDLDRKSISQQGEELFSLENTLLDYRKALI